MAPYWPLIECLSVVLFAANLFWPVLGMLRVLLGFEFTTTAAGKFDAICLTSFTIMNLKSYINLNEKKIQMIRRFTAREGKRFRWVCGRFCFKII